MRSLLILWQSTDLGTPFVNLRTPFRITKKYLRIQYFRRFYWLINFSETAIKSITVSRFYYFHRSFHLLFIILEAFCLWALNDWNEKLPAQLDCFERVRYLQPKSLWIDENQRWSNPSKRIKQGYDEFSILCQKWSNRPDLLHLWNLSCYFEFSSWKDLKTIHDFCFSIGSNITSIGL